MNHHQSAQTLYAFNSGFFFQRRIRRILSLSGYNITLGRPASTDTVVVWGQGNTAHRGRKVANRSGASLLYVEDPMLRSLMPGRSGSAPMGLLLDKKGLHFDPAQPSELEHVLQRNPLDDAAILSRAKSAIHRLKYGHLTKYTAVDPTLAPPDPGFVLVLDQARDDASVRASNADRSTFIDMLAAAQIEHPDAEIVIKSHPETQNGYRPGYYRETDLNHRTQMCDQPHSPWTLLENARAVYTVSSQMGFEAILAGHKPRLFGQPFYCSWGLSQDEYPVARRQRTLSRNQLFAAAMMLYPTWYDPQRDRLCEVEDVIDQLEAEARVWREDKHGYVASGMRLWKRPTIQKFFGRHKRVTFKGDLEAARRHSSTSGQKLMVWGSPKRVQSDIPVSRVEDGFLRSRGLGAKLIPPMSLIRDNKGIYFDPTRPNELESWIERRSNLESGERLRVIRLIEKLIKYDLSKYAPETNPLPDLPIGHRILVPGQVEDDASVRMGCPHINRNIDLLKHVRRENPHASIIYKVHPDVAAGLRPGEIDAKDAKNYADLIIIDANPAQLLNEVDEVWTMTSLMGFEALLRGVSVTCVGVPFYAGWGLTRDLVSTPERRRARPGIEGLAHAALIDYPRHLDPISRLPCSVELVVDRLIAGQYPKVGPASRLLSRVQGVFASQSWIWRH